MHTAVSQPARSWCMHTAVAQPARSWRRPNCPPLCCNQVLAERAAWEFAEKEGLDLVAMNPVRESRSVAACGVTPWTPSHKAHVVSHFSGCPHFANSADLCQNSLCDGSRAPLSGSFPCRQLINRQNAVLTGLPQVFVMARCQACSWVMLLLSPS